MKRGKYIWNELHFETKSDRECIQKEYVPSNLYSTCGSSPPIFLITDIIPSLKVHNDCLLGSAAEAVRINT